LSDQPPKPTCPICNYSLEGIEPDEHRRLTCPECGTPLKPASPNTIFTKQKFHLVFLYIFVIPTIITNTTPIVGAFLPMEIGVFVIIFHVMVNPLILISLAIAASISAFVRSKRYPRPYPRWTVLLWVLLYSLPGSAMYFFTLYVFGQVY
jgi:uncharacterized membrane protein YozB (DUF420 family)